jgi:hypothetical protein
MPSTPDYARVGRAVSSAAYLVRAWKMNAEPARKIATAAVREADRAEAHAWSLRMEGFGGPAQPTKTCAGDRFGDQPIFYLLSY